MKDLKKNELMRAAVFKGKSILEIEDVPVPSLKKADDVLMKVEASGICGTELHITSIPQKHEAGIGTILGHEYIGEVVEIGKDVKDLKIGDRVVPNSMTPCGACEYCDTGFPNMCENVIRLGVFDNGGFAEYSMLPERALFKISKNLSPELGILIEPAACIVNSLKSIGFLLGKSVAVLGGGPMGQLFLQLIKKSGAGNIFLSEVSSIRRRLGNKNGADFLIDPREEDIGEFIRKKINNGPDIVIDAVGTLMEYALKIVKKNGKVVLFGNDNSAVAKIKPTDILLNEINIINSFAVKNTYTDTIKIVESGLIDPKNIITKIISLEELGEGIKLLKKQLELKIMIKNVTPGL